MIAFAITKKKGARYILDIDTALKKVQTAEIVKTLKTNIDVIILMIFVRQECPFDFERPHIQTTPYIGTVEEVSTAVLNQSVSLYETIVKFEQAGTGMLTQVARWFHKEFKVEDCTHELKFSMSVCSDVFLATTTLVYTSPGAFGVTKALMLKVFAGKESHKSYMLFKSATKRAVFYNDNLTDYWQMERLEAMAGKTYFPLLDAIRAATEKNELASDEIGEAAQNWPTYEKQCRQGGVQALSDAILESANACMTRIRAQPTPAEKLDAYHTALSAIATHVADVRILLPEIKEIGTKAGIAKFRDQTIAAIDAIGDDINEEKALTAIEEAFRHTSQKSFGSDSDQAKMKSFCDRVVATFEKDKAGWEQRCLEVASSIVQCIHDKNVSLEYYTKIDGFARLGRACANLKRFQAPAAPGFDADKTFNLLAKDDKALGDVESVLKNGMGEEFFDETILEEVRAIQKEVQLTIKTYKEKKMEVPENNLNTKYHDLASRAGGCGEDGKSWKEELVNGGIDSNTDSLPQILIVANKPGSLLSIDAKQFNKDYKAVEKANLMLAMCTIRTIVICPGTLAHPLARYTSLHSASYPRSPRSYTSARFSHRTHATCYSR